MGYRRGNKNVGGAVLAALVLAGLAQHGATSPAAAPVQAALAPASGNVALGQQLAGAYGWNSGPQWDCLDALWERESGWSNTAENRQSGAYGIPQALPPSKMPAAALPPESDAGTQVRWGLGYIRARYGTPCGAWAHEEEMNWY